MGQFGYTILWLFLFVIEIWLMFMVFTDIFRSHDLKGWAKAVSVLFVLIVPLIGILAYLERARRQVRRSCDRDGSPERCSNVRLTNFPNWCTSGTSGNGESSPKRSVNGRSVRSLTTHQLRHRPTSA